MGRTGQVVQLPKGYQYLRAPFKKFREQFPHLDRNVFVMMPFAGSRADRIFRAVSRSIEKHGLVALRADQRIMAQTLWWNVLTYMIGSSYGIVIYDPANRIPFNPNVSIEAGFMLAMDRPVLLLANQRLRALPVDFSGHIFKTFTEARLSATVAAAVSDWLERDISYFPYGDKKLVVFVSLGGTCRCVMAKAILSDRLARAKVTTVVVEAAAVADPHHSAVSPSGVRALKEIGCDQYIRGHRPRKLSPYLQDRADLVVALTDGSLARDPNRGQKVVTDQDLFGRRVTNPYPDRDDSASHRKYRRACRQIAGFIDSHFEEILDLAGARPRL